MGTKFRRNQKQTHSLLLLHAFRFAIEPGDEPITTPKLDVMTIDITFGPLDRLLIAGANDGIELDEMPVESDRIGSIVGHSQYPPRRETNLGIVSSEDGSLLHTGTESAQFLFLMSETRH